MANVLTVVYQSKKGELAFAFFSCVAEWTGLEPATPGVTGRYSNRLNYHSSQSYCARYVLRRDIFLVNADFGGC
jgi:hypothetical protein